jgi:hypothetical protein
MNFAIMHYTQVDRFIVHARPGATAVIKEINPLLLKTYAVDNNFLKSGLGQGFPVKVP